MYDTRKGNSRLPRSTTNNLCQYSRWDTPQRAHSRYIGHKGPNMGMPCLVDDKVSGSPQRRVRAPGRALLRYRQLLPLAPMLPLLQIPKSPFEKTCLA